MKSILIFPAVIALFAACSDNITLESSENSAMQVIDFGEKLADCTKENIGEMVFVADSNAVFYCAEGVWRSLNGKDGIDGKDGENGKNGEDGKTGATGKDTVVVSKIDTVLVNRRDTVVVDNRDTVVVSKVDTVLVSKVDTVLVNRRDTVVVDNRDTVVVSKIDTVLVSKVDTVWVSRCDTVVINNIDTIVVDNRDTLFISNGMDGLPAVGCSIVEDNDGIVVMKCGEGIDSTVTKLYKAICGKTPYDPEIKVCLDGGLLPVCENDVNGSIVQNTNQIQYTCVDGVWKESSEIEILMGKACLPDIAGDMYAGSDEIYRVCRDEGWTEATEKEIAIGKSCVESNQGESLALAYSNWKCRADSIGWVYDFENLNKDSPSMN